jgi:hypothetical protein
MKKLIMVVAVAVGAWHLGAVAHEGHNHDAPTTIKAPKGGIIKALDESLVEVVTKGKNVKIYFYDKERNPTAAAGFKVEAHAELPRSKNKETIVLSAHEFFYEADWDAKGAHRYTLKLAVTDYKTNRTENLKFTVEPRR